MNHTSPKKAVLLMVLILLVVAVDGCGEDPQVPQVPKTTKTADTSLIPQIELIPSGNPLEPEVISTEIALQNQCGNPGDMVYRIEKSRTIERTMKVEGGIVVKADGTLSGQLPGGIVEGSVTVGTAVSGLYGVSYGEKETLTKSVEPVVKGGTHMSFTVELLELWDTGNLVITIGDETFTYPYRMRHSFEIRIADSQDLGCPPTPSPDTPPTDSTPTEPPAIDSLQGYVLYDDFTAANTFEDRWRINDQDGLCKFEVGEEGLSFACNNQSTEDNGAALHPNVPYGQNRGVAARVHVDKVGGPFQLTMNWKCETEELERDYHLELDTGLVTAKEYYPQKDWASKVLGEMEVAEDSSHLLQIEHTPDGVVFYVDGQPLSLSSPPDFLDCASPDHWGFAFWIWRDNNSIIGQIEEVYIRN